MTSTKTVPEAEEAEVTEPGRAATVRRGPWWLYAVLGAGLLLMVVPFLWMVLSSVKPEGEVMSVPPTWWPETLTTDNYEALFTNDVIVTAITALG